MNKTKVTIILPCYNSGDYLVDAVESIINNTKYPFQLYIVESESTDNTPVICDILQEKYSQIKVFHTKKEGITKAINFAIKQTDTDVYLTQDDVILPKLYKRDWLSILKKISEFDDCGIVTTLGAGGVSGPDYIDGFRWTGTWSLYIPRKTVEKVGLLDENFSPGPGDDIDYSYRIEQAKLKRYVAPFWVDHHRATEHQNDDIENIKKRNAEYFRKKWNIKN